MIPTKRRKMCSEKCFSRNALKKKRKGYTMAANCIQMDNTLVAKEHLDLMVICTADQAK